MHYSHLSGEWIVCNSPICREKIEKTSSWENGKCGNAREKKEQNKKKLNRTNFQEHVLQASESTTKAAFARGHNKTIIKQKGTIQTHVTIPDHWLGEKHKAWTPSVPISSLESLKAWFATRPSLTHTSW